MTADELLSTAATSKLDVDQLRNAAQAAHSGTSFVPERRAQQHVDDVLAHLRSIAEWIVVNAPEQMRATLYAEYEAGYLRRYYAWLASMSRIMSTMIAGPSNFPVRQMEKRNRSEHNRNEDLVNYTRRARRRMEKRIRWATLPDDPAAEVRAEIANLERQLAAMKFVNATLRKRKLSLEQKVQAVVAELRVSEETATRWLTTEDCFGGLGFQAFELTSLRGKIERQNAKLATLESAPSEPLRGEGWEVEEDGPADRLRIHFDAKPDAEMIARLKRGGFRWSPTNGAWQRQLTEQARIVARRVLGVGA